MKERSSEVITAKMAEMISMAMSKGKGVAEPEIEAPSSPRGFSGNNTKKKS